MPDSRVFGPAYASIQKIADQALGMPNGLVITFHVDKLLTLENCKHQARSFQTQFTSLRARTNRLSARLLGEGDTPKRDSAARGIYSSLMCQRSIFEDRVEVYVGQSAEVFNQFDIRDAATGEPLESVGRKNAERDRLNAIASAHPEKLTQYEHDRLGELVPGYWSALTPGGPEPWFPRPGDPTPVPQAPRTLLPHQEPAFAAAFGYDGNKLPEIEMPEDVWRELEARGVIKPLDNSNEEG